MVLATFQHYTENKISQDLQVAIEFANPNRDFFPKDVIANVIIILCGCEA